MTADARRAPFRSTPFRRGKVRDVYVVDDDRLLLVATDRVSAFDVVMAETIPHKGAVLTQITAWWLRQLERRGRRTTCCRPTPTEIVREVPALRAHERELAGRAMLCRRADGVPDRMRRARLSLRARRGRNTAQHGTLAGEPLPQGPARVRSPRSAALQPGDQGRGRPRREHHRQPHGGRVVGERCGGGAGAALARGLRARARDRGGARNHHRRHEVRVRPSRTATAPRRLYWWMKCSRPTARASGRPTATSRGTRSPASTSSPFATISTRRSARDAGTATIRRRRCPKT